MNRKQMILVIGSFLTVGALIVASMYLENGQDEGEGINVVATFYPLAYMAETIGGERVTVSSLVPYNSELHSWQPSPQDIIKADGSDIILYNGGPADAWLVDDVLPAIGTGDKVVVNTTAGVTYISGGDEDDGGEGVDPHTWLSPKEAQVQATNVYLALCEVDPEGIDYFTSRFATLNQTLSNLDQQYSLLSGGLLSDVIVSHSALGYVANEYGFNQYGVIGLSGDAQPTIETMIDLAQLMKDEGIYTLFLNPIDMEDYVSTLKSELESRTGHQVTILDMYLALGPYEDYDYIDQLSMNLIGLKAGLEVQ